MAIICSGFASLHDLDLIFRGKTYTEEFKKRQTAWNNALEEALKEQVKSARAGKLVEWRNFPNAYEMHSKNGGEHFMSLLVCSGAAGHSKLESDADNIWKISVWTYYWK